MTDQEVSGGEEDYGVGGDCHEPYGEVFYEGSWSRCHSDVGPPSLRENTAGDATGTSAPHSEFEAASPGG